MSPENLTAQLKAEARRLGFDLAGATAAVAPPRLGAFQQWLADGFAGEMKYLPAGPPPTSTPSTSWMAFAACSCWPCPTARRNPSSLPPARA